MVAVRKKILIVEDEGIIAIDLKRRLVQAGYQVTGIAADSPEAMASIESELPDLVLMDIRLRGPEDGVATAERIRRTSHLPIVYVTAHADADTLERAKITEPFGYIVKPFTGVNFHAQIEMALWKHAMERKLRASEAWLSATFRNAADALITTDAEGNIVLMNSPAARLTGWDPEEARGRGLFEVFQVFDAKTGMPAVHPLETIYDERPLDSSTSTYRLIRADGRSALVEAEISANRDAQGVLLGVISAFRDVTVRQEGEEREFETQKKSAIALFAMGIAGDLAQSLAQVDRQLAETIKAAKGKTLQALTGIREASAQMQRLVRQLAGLGRTEPGPSVTMHLNSTIMTMESQFRKVLGSSRSLNLRLQPGLAPIQVEAEEMRQNLLRLVTEAREAMPYGGIVDLETRGTVAGDGRRMVQLIVRDYGKGIRASIRGRVFEPYFPSRPGNRSSGMSLALVRQFVTLNGGEVEIEAPVGEKRGTAFRLTFPAAAPARAPVPEAKEGSLRASSSNGE